MTWSKPYSASYNFLLHVIGLGNVDLATQKSGYNRRNPQGTNVVNSLPIRVVATDNGGEEI
jgi:hypothetical protein